MEEAGKLRSLEAQKDELQSHFVAHRSRLQTIMLYGQLNINSTSPKKETDSVAVLLSILQPLRGTHFMIPIPEVKEVICKSQIALEGLRQQHSDGQILGLQGENFQGLSGIKCLQCDFGTNCEGYRSTLSFLLPSGTFPTTGEQSRWQVLIALYFSPRGEKLPEKWFLGAGNDKLQILPWVFLFLCAPGSQAGLLDSRQSGSHPQAPPGSGLFLCSPGSQSVWE